MNPVPSQPPSRPSLVLSSGLIVLAFGALASAGWIYVSRSQVASSPSDSKQGFAMLERSMHSERVQSLSASVESVSFVCGEKVVSKSKVVQSPQQTSIQWVSGPMQGAQSGFSNRWFWRQAPDGKIQSYSEVSSSNQQAQAHRFRLLMRNYNAVLGEKSELVGREVQVLEIKPKAETVKGPARRFFIDVETGVALKTQGFDSELNPVFETSLRDVDFTPQIGATTFEKPAVVLAATKKTIPQGEEFGSDTKRIVDKLGFLPPKSVYLPAGFELDGYGLHRCQTPDGMTQCASFARYSDGLNSLTVFAMKPCGKAEKKASNAPAICDFGAGILASRQVAQGRLIAVADLPSKELQKVLAASDWQAK